jgi:hypothetical protein
MKKEIINVQASRAPTGLTPLAGSLLTTTVGPPRVVGGAGRPLSVTYSVTTGLRAEVEVSWQAEHEWYERDYTVQGFISERELPDPSRSAGANLGRRFLSRRCNESERMPLASGTHYFTFVLAREKPITAFDRCQAFLNCERLEAVVGAVQFMVHVPGAAEAVARVKEESLLMQSLIEHQHLRKDLETAMGINVEDPVEAHRRKVETDLRKREAERRQVEAHYMGLIEEIATDPRLDDTQRGAALDRLQNRLDAELRARNLY